MTTRLQAIKAAVDAHFAEWDEVKDDLRAGTPYYLILTHRHEAMCMLRDVLPLLRLEVILAQAQLTDAERYAAIFSLRTEVEKLTEEVEG